MPGGRVGWGFHALDPGSGNGQIGVRRYFSYFANSVEGTKSTFGIWSALAHPVASVSAYSASHSI